MPYFFIIDEETDFAIDVENFAKQLRASWPSVRFEDIKITNDPFLLHWSLREGEIDHVGSLHRDRRTISVDDYPKGVARFALWIRAFLPEQHKLMLYHDSSDIAVEITPKTQAEDLIVELNRG